MSRFVGKAAVVLGGSGGIGSAVARGFVREGGSVVVAARDEARLSETVADLAKIAGRDDAVFGLRADASSASNLEALASFAVARLGRIDGWVHAVGSIFLKPVCATSEEDFERQLSINLTSAFRSLKAALNPMRKARGGSIVLFGSAAGTLGLPNHAAIAAAKAGVVGMAKAAAMDLVRYGVRVNVVAPGLVRTPMSAAITNNKASLDASVAMHPTGRISESEDVAAAVLYLLSDGAANVTGAVLPVDGGLSAGRTSGA